MKRIISAFLAIMLACTIFPCGNVKAASDKKEAGEAYAVIIQKYLDAYEAVMKMSMRNIWEHFTTNQTFRYIGFWILMVMEVWNCLLV